MNTEQNSHSQAAQTVEDERRRIREVGLAMVQSWNSLEVGERYGESSWNFFDLHILVGGDWNMTGLFFHSVGKFLIPIEELIFFRGFETTNQYLYPHCIDNRYMYIYVYTYTDIQVPAKSSSLGI